MVCLICGSLSDENFIDMGICLKVLPHQLTARERCLYGWTLAATGSLHADNYSVLLDFLL